MARFGVTKLQELRDNSNYKSTRGLLKTIFILVGIASTLGCFLVMFSSPQALIIAPLFLLLNILFLIAAYNFSVVIFDIADSLICVSSSD